jgi:hypothetical protein
MTLRLILWGLVVILVLGSVWQFLRALRLGRAPMTVSRSAAAAEPGDDAAGGDDDEDGFDYAPQLRPVSATIATPPEQVVPAQPALVPTPVVPAPEVFQLELEVRHLQRELEGQQELIALQRAQIEALHSELGGLHLQLADAVVAQPSTSPEYSEAMQLAGQGHDAQEIAARCGISVAEAGLVQSLARAGGARS